MTDMYVSIALTVIFSILVLYVLIRILYHPMRWFFRLLVHVAGGLIILVVFNFLASFWGISIGINLVTGLLVGVMGVPGLVMLVCLQLML